MGMQSLASSQLARDAACPCRTAMGLEYHQGRAQLDAEHNLVCTRSVSLDNILKNAWPQQLRLLRGQQWKASRINLFKKPCWLPRVHRYTALSCSITFMLARGHILHNYRLFDTKVLGQDHIVNKWDIFRFVP